MLTLKATVATLIKTGLFLSSFFFAQFSSGSSFPRHDADCVLAKSTRYLPLRHLERPLYLCAFSSVCGVLATDGTTKDSQPRFVSVCILIVRQSSCNLITYSHDLFKITGLFSINSSKLLSKMEHSVLQFKIIVSFSVETIFSDKPLNQTSRSALTLTISVSNLVITFN